MSESNELCFGGPSNEKKLENAASIINFVLKKLYVYANIFTLCTPFSLNISPLKPTGNYVQQRLQQPKIQFVFIGFV
jgi:hypothetical protein